MIQPLQHKEQDATGSIYLGCLYVPPPSLCRVKTTALGWARGEGAASWEEKAIHLFKASVDGCTVGIPIRGWCGYAADSLAYACLVARMS